MPPTSIASVEVFAFHPKLHGGDRRAVDMAGIELRDAFKVVLESGVVGWGEARPDGGAPHAGPAQYDFLVGRNAADLLRTNEPNVGGNANGNPRPALAASPPFTRHNTCANQATAACSRRCTTRWRRTSACPSTRCWARSTATGCPAPRGPGRRAPQTSRWSSGERLSRATWR